jgi:MFS family permease
LRKRRCAIITIPDKNHTTKEIIEKRNGRLLTIDGILFYASRALFDYNVLVPAYLSQLGAPSFLIGLAVSINRLGFFLPQFFVANYAAARALNKSILLLGVRMYIYALIALVSTMFLFGGHSPSASLAIFLILYSISCVGDGIQALPWVDILAKSIHSTKRGRFLGYMQTLGGIASFGMAALVGWVMSRHWLAFPVNYIYLVSLAALLGFGSLKVLDLLQEPAKAEVEARQPLRDYLCGIPAMIRGNPGLKRFLLVRALSQSFFLSAPFYVTYAIDVQKAPTGLIGWFIAAQMAGITVGGIALGYIGDFWGNSRAVQSALTVSLVSPLAGLALEQGLAGSSFGASLVPIYLLLYFFLGASLAGIWMAMQNYLLELVNPSSQPSCLGLANILTAPVSLLPMLGGIVVAGVGYSGLFAITIMLSLTALTFSLKMREPRKESLNRNNCLDQ